MNSAYVMTVFMAPPAWVLSKVRELVAEGDAPERTGALTPDALVPLL